MWRSNHRQHGHSHFDINVLGTAVHGRLDLLELVRAELFEVPFELVRNLVLWEGGVEEEGAVLDLDRELELGGAPLNGVLELAQPDVAPWTCLSSE